METPPPTSLEIESLLAEMDRKLALATEAVESLRRDARRGMQKCQDMIDEIDNDLKNAQDNGF
jgi:hypothetical protein